MQQPGESPWHPGEQALQARVGVTERMEAFGRKVIRDHMPEQHRDFYRQLPFMLLGSVDAQGRPWAGIVEGVPGFAHAVTPQLLRLDSHLQAEDPATAALQPGAAIGLLGIELHTRRRNRLNGHVQQVDENGLAVSVDQAFGNCPQYIQLRQHQLPSPQSRAERPAAERLNGLDDAARALIAQADTFFVASYVRQADGDLAVDVSHRGGQAGFVRIAGNRLSIPDFAGNLHFNTLGNLLLNPQAGLLFIDFASGDLLQLSGRTELTLEGAEIQAFQGAERLWHLEVEQLVRRKAALALRWQFQDYSPNSLLTGNWADAQARLAAEALRDQWRALRVTRITEESASIRSFYLEPADGAGLPLFQAGQHLPLRLHIAGQAQPLIRTYSLSSAPSDGFLRISVKRAGLASTHLHEQVVVGSLLEARAPQGRFCLDAEQRRPLVLLAAGVGITPLLAMLREVIYQNQRQRRSRRVWLILGARNLAELAFDQELKTLLQRGGDPIHGVRLLSQPEAHARAGEGFERSGRIDSELLKTLLPFDDFDFYLCGPGGFTQDLYDGLRALNIGDRRIHAETFGPSSLRRRPDPDGAATPQPPAANRAMPVRFQRSAKEARWQPGSGSLLELAESRGLNPPFSCRGGSCGTCATRLLGGQVHYPNPPAEAPAAGEVLICCAVPAAGGPLVLDL
ncbi:2Fe-2S iron-sulfur cluster binding domain-containing protein [Pseudomonas sp. R-28-1W-6]|uniref:pyridoxamine 5'-phosphate oxidase family protein n=1 Tax=Pseudomonas sp. R-28-1W-6 TaxID=2650101 RepID=UPI001365641C|nr:pyridoxamine 5'-phosphate oxidase family protein [Pseudomonas sp. R-28-1W-6]MWV13698.1 2Fe-2S iron-sulfur cluster binding domain-containing protein [Pseudomonas sp. R-28-1W-6]